MELTTLIVGPFEVNCYLYRDPLSMAGVVFDPGGNEDLIIDTIEQTGVNLRAILLTHGHGDHIAAVAAIKQRFDVPLYISEEDAALLADPSDLVSTFYGRPVTAPPADAYVTDEQVLAIGPMAFRVLATPGHTPGGVCYLDENEGLLFCGDTLFAGSIGRTDLPGGSYARLIDSIRSKILTLPDGIVCLPGHGPQTTVGAEKTGNPFLTGDYAV